MYVVFARLPVEVVPARPMDAGAAAALIHLRVAVRRLESLRALAVEAILLVHARASVATGARRTLVYLHVTLGT